MKVTMDKLTKQFDDNYLFEQLNLTISAGEFVAIKGKSGSGKTTLLNCLALIKPASNGKIYFDEKDVTRLQWYKKSRLYRREISFIVQNFGLMENETVRDNLNIALKYEKLSKKEIQIRCKAALIAVNLDATLLTESIFRLSGGEQQRVAIARCLLRQPRLLFADEPVAALDNENATVIMMLLKKINASGCTIIMVTHDNHFDDYYDSIITI